MTVSSITTVFVGTVALMRDASDLGDSRRPSWLITAAAMSLLSARSAYEVTRCWVSCSAAMIEPTSVGDCEAETNRLTLEAYSGVVERLKASAAPPPTIVISATISHRRRSSSR